MRVLFLSAWFPDPPSNGSRLRVRALLQALAPRHQVTLLSFADAPDVDPTAPALAALCRSVQVIHRRWGADAPVNRLAWLSRRPRSLVETFSPAMAAAVRRAVVSTDVVVASQIDCAAYAPWFGAAPALFEEVELGALHGQIAAASGLRRWRARLMWAKHRRYLRRLLRRFHACTVVSEEERARLAAILGSAASIHLLPNGVLLDASPAAQPPEPDTVIFTGSVRYRPNYDAMRWFIGDVWPRIRRARPQARLIITGAHDDLPLPGADQVVRTGFVPDVRPLIAASAVAIAPIFTGGGTRLKILEAMAVATPVVATAKGMEGLAAVPDRDLLVADEADRFAAHVEALLADPALARRIGLAGRGLVEAHYDWRVLGPQFAALVEQVAATRGTAASRARG